MAEENVGTRDADEQVAGTDTPPNRRRTLVWAAVAVAVVLVMAALVYAEYGGSNSPSANTAGSGEVAEGSSAGETGTAVAPDAGRPTEPAAGGSQLTTITQPPEATLAMIEPTQLAADARYDIVFSPFGFGPPQSGRPSLVVRVTEATAANESAQAMDFTGRNVLAEVSSGEDAITLGGTYSAVLTFRDQAGLLIPQIGEIEELE